MIVRVLGYKNGTSTKKDTGEVYTFVRVYVACEPSSPTDVDEGETCQTLFFRTKGLQRYNIGESYLVQSDVHFFNGQPQIRITGLGSVTDHL